MNKIMITCLLLVCSFFQINAQSVNDNVDTKPLYFSNFSTGVFTFKDGRTDTALVNYNTENQKIIFIKDGYYMYLDNIELLKTVTINDKVFVPINDKFYGLTTKSGLFVTYSKDYKVNGVTIDQSGSSVKNIGEVSNNLTNNYLLRNQKNYNTFVFKEDFWLLNKNKLVEVKNLKQLSKHFNKDKKEIKDFIKENKIDINNYFGVLSLLDFLKVL